MKSIFYDWGGLNVWLFHLINGFHVDWLDRCMLLGTQLAEHSNFNFYLAGLVLIAILSTRDRDRKSLQLWLGVITVFALGFLLDGMLVGMLKDWYAFPRPELALPPGSMIVVGSPEHNLQHSLPSGHTSFAMLIAASLWPVMGRYWRTLAVGFVLWAGLSRISLGAHFPADVVAGALSCLLLVWLIRNLVQGMQR